MGSYDLCGMRNLGLPGFSGSQRIPNITGSLVTADGSIFSYGIGQNIAANNPIIFTYTGPLHNIRVREYGPVTGFEINSSGGNILTGIMGLNALILDITGTYNINYYLAGLEILPNDTLIYLKYNNVEIPNSVNFIKTSSNMNYTITSTGHLELFCKKTIKVNDQNRNYSSVTSMTSGGVSNTSASIRFSGSRSILVVAYNNNITNLSGSVGITPLNLNNIYNNGFYVSQSEYDSDESNTVNVTGLWNNIGDDMSLSVFGFIKTFGIESEFVNFHYEQINGINPSINYIPTNSSSQIIIITTINNDNIISITEPASEIIATDSNGIYRNSIYLSKYFSNPIKFTSSTGGPINCLVFEVPPTYTPNYFARLNVMRIND